jgi:uncharacterized glyoxalase superfamily protein PhnB
MATRHIAAGFNTVTPYLTIQGVPAFIEFLKAAFGAVEGSRMLDSSGQVWYADVQIGGSKIMMGEAMDRPISASAFYLYVPDTDATYHRSIEAGATPVMEPADQFYGDRNAGVSDQWGNTWWIATHLKDVSPEEAQKMAEERRAAKA